MAGSLNRVDLIGNLGADPEARSFQNGGEVVNLRIATSESWKDKGTGEKKERTEWHQVAVFGEGLCRVAKSYLRKGSKVYLSGQLRTRKWQDQSGNDRYSTEVVVDGFNGKLLLLDRKQDGGGGYGGGGATGGAGGDYNGGAGQSSGTRPQPAAFDTDLDDDVPF